MLTNDIFTVYKICYLHVKCVTLLSILYYYYGIKKRFVTNPLWISNCLRDNLKSGALYIEKIFTLIQIIVKIKVLRVLVFSINKSTQKSSKLYTYNIRQCWCFIWLFEMKIALIRLYWKSMENRDIGLFVSKQPTTFLTKLIGLRENIVT